MTVPASVCRLGMAVPPYVDVMGPLAINTGGPHIVKGSVMRCRQKEHEEGEQVLMPAA